MAEEQFQYLTCQPVFTESLAKYGSTPVAPAP
jgi:hypothetical protein